MKNSIRVERAVKNITQQDLAVAVGVSRQTIKSARYFEKRVEDIFTLEDED